MRLLYGSPKLQIRGCNIFLAEPLEMLKNRVLGQEDNDVE